MEFQKRPINSRAAALNRAVEARLNRYVRARDAAKAKLGLGGRRADYDDERYEFVGGEGDRMRRLHYDKSLRLLWKAEAEAPWSSFKDCSKAERLLMEMADEAMTPAERRARDRISSEEFRAMLDREYTLREKQAIVQILSAIGHGEAYAWLVAAEVLREVRSTGAKAAVTMQVLEEAKHFVVLRELLRAFEVEIPRQSAWEYIWLERVLKAEGLEKFFGMNVLVEGVALSLFGLLSGLPGLEILRLFHMDEARHTGLPLNYFKDHPMSLRQRHSPRARIARFRMMLPTVPLIFLLEEDAAELGIDAVEFGGSILRKVSLLSERAGFYTVMPYPMLRRTINAAFNAWCAATREDHEWRDFTTHEATRGVRERQVERSVFGAGAVRA